MRIVKSFSDVNIELKALQTKLDTFFTKEIDLKMRKITNAAAAVNPNDYVILSQLPLVEAPITPDDQNLAIVFSTAGAIQEGDQISPPYNPGEFRTGIPQWVRLAATVAPFGGNLICNVSWRRKGATNATKILTFDITLPAGQNGPVKSLGFISPLPFFDADDTILPTCTSANGASLVSLIIGVKRKVIGSV